MPNHIKGVVLAGGTGSRLWPLTKITNKHLLPVGRKPMIFYPIEKLAAAGMEEVLVVTGTEHMGDVVGLLGSGKDFGTRLTYKVQDQAGGIAQALALAENFAGGSAVAVILGDNMFQDSLSADAATFLEQKSGARILLKEVDDPERFGVAEVRDGKVVGIEEKPKRAKSRYAVTGIYFYDGRVFDVIHRLKPSARGEYEITDVNNAYIADNSMTYGFLRGWWSDAGTFESLERVQQLVAEG